MWSGLGAGVGVGVEGEPVRRGKVGRGDVGHVEGAAGQGVRFDEGAPFLFRFFFSFVGEGVMVVSVV